MNLLFAFLLAWVSTLSGVALGGFLVFKTKREHFDSLFTGQKPGDSFNIQDDYSDLVENGSKARIPKEIQKANTAFVDQFANDLANPEEVKHA